MAKLTATILTMAGTASAFAPIIASVPKTSALSEFAKGMVGGEGPEPMPFNFGGEKTSKNFDPVGFSEVSSAAVVSEGKRRHGGRMTDILRGGKNRWNASL